MQGFLDDDFPWSFMLRISTVYTSCDTSGFDGVERLNFPCIKERWPASEAKQALGRGQGWSSSVAIREVWQ
jgi:hypothetical protein